MTAPPQSCLTSGGAGWLPLNNTVGAWGPLGLAAFKKGWKTLGLDGPDPLFPVFPDLSCIEEVNLEEEIRGVELRQSVRLSRVSVTD